MSDDKQMIDGADPREPFIIAKPQQSERPENRANPGWKNMDWEPCDKVCEDCGKLVWRAPWTDDTRKNGGAVIGEQWECGDCGWSDSN